MAARQPDVDPTPLPRLLVGATGPDAALLAALDAAPIPISQASRWLNPLDPDPLTGPPAPAPAT